MRDSARCGVLEYKNRRGGPAKKEKDEIMKNLNKVLFAAALAATVSLANDASAQYKPTGEDGITASPSLRQRLNERAAASNITPSAPSVTMTYRTPGLEGVTASPAVLQKLGERKVLVSTSPSGKAASPGYQATGSDGITASPSLRQRLDERATPFMIAPLK